MTVCRLKKKQNVFRSRQYIISVCSFCIIHSCATCHGALCVSSCSGDMSIIRNHKTHITLCILLTEIGALTFAALHAMYETKYSQALILWLFSICARLERRVLESLQHHFKATAHRNYLPATAWLPKSERRYAE